MRPSRLLIFTLTAASAASDAMRAQTLAVPAVVEPRGQVGASAPALDVPADAELAELAQLLELWRADDFSSGHWKLQALSLRLMCFEARFGVAARECEGWERLTSAAGRALEMLQGVLASPIRSSHGLLDSRIGVQLCSTRALMLELSGRDEEAERLLFNPRRGEGVAVSDLEMVHQSRCCQFCLARDSQLEAFSRSAFLKRHGRGAEALESMHVAVLDQPQANVSPGTWDLFQAGYGALLMESGQRAAAACVLQATRSYDSKAMGSRIAGEILERAGLPRDDAKARFVIRAWFPDSWDRAAFVFAGVEGDQQSLMLLASRLPILSEPECWDPLTRPLRVMSQATGFDGVAAEVEIVLRDAAGTLRTLPLAVLLALDPSTRQLLPKFSADLLAEDDRLRVASEPASLDRLVLGGGPEVQELDARLTTPDDLRALWSEWFGSVGR